MKGLVLFSLIILLALDQNQDYGNITKHYQQNVPLSLTTMDALIVVMWESAVSRVIYFTLLVLHNNGAVSH